MINSVNRVYSLVRKVIYELTYIEVYNNTSRNRKVVDAKWLFATTVYTLFYKTDLLNYLPKPYLYDISFQLGYIDNDSITNLMRSKRSEEIKELGKQLTKFCESKLKKE